MGAHVMAADDNSGAPKRTNSPLLLGSSVSSCEQNHEDGKAVHGAVVSKTIQYFRQRFDVVEVPKNENSLFRCFIQILEHFHLGPVSRSLSVKNMRSLLATHFGKNHERFTGGATREWNSDSFCTDITNGCELDTTQAALMISTFVDLFPVEVRVYTTGQSEDQPDFYLCTFGIAADSQLMKHRATLLREIEFSTDTTDEEDSGSECCENVNFHWVRNRNPTDSAFNSIHDPLPRDTLFSSEHIAMQDHIKILPGVDGKTCDADW